MPAIHRSHHFTGPENQTGFSLVEVMVSLLIFTVGLAGLSLMLLTSVRGTRQAQNETIAATQASSLAELILMNPAALGHYINPEMEYAEHCIAPTQCDAAAWAAGNLAHWHMQLEQSLALSSGLVCRDSSPNDGSRDQPACDGVGPAVVKVFWSDHQGLKPSERHLQRAVSLVEP